MVEVTKADWKLFREKLSNWQENYMEKLNKEYVELLMGEGLASEKFWELEKRIKQDMRHSGVVMEMRKSEMVYDLVRLVREKVICESDLEGFSEDIKEAVSFMAKG